MPSLAEVIWPIMCSQQQQCLQQCSMQRLLFVRDVPIAEQSQHCDSAGAKVPSKQACALADLCMSNVTDFMQAVMHHVFIQLNVQCVMPKGVTAALCPCQATHFCSATKHSMHHSSHAANVQVRPLSWLVLLNLSTSTSFAGNGQHACHLHDYTLHVHGNKDLTLKLTTNARGYHP
jgi:hypothetical protein